MRLFHETHYFVYNELVKRSINICVLSDLHYSDSVRKEQLIRILKKLEQLRPDYVFFCGDMIDSVDDIDKILIWWWKRIGDISKALISIGSHDYFKCVVENEKISGKCVYPSEFFDEINDLDNVFVLNNEFYEDEDLFVTGYTQSLDYYYPQRFAKKTFFHTIKEDKQIMIKELSELISKIKNMPMDKLRFLLVHAPTYVFSPEILNLINNYNYAIGGHTHNGLVPPILYELWHSTRGIITPDRVLFQEKARNTLRNKGDKVIVNGPLTTFQKCSGGIELFNALYPSYITNLTISNDRLYDTEKIYTKIKYSK